MSAKLKVEGLRKRYGAVQALDGVSFEVRAGEVFGLLGPNGAGKTTAVESLAGLTRPDSGSIEICGVDARRYPHEARQRLGLALAATSLQDKITPREAIESFGAFYPRSVPAAELLGRFELDGKAEAYFETLSTGQKQRLALALAEVNEPELLVLDEPTAGLDLDARRNLYGSIERIKRTGGAVLMTTHDLDDAQRLCDRVAVIQTGKIVAEGSPADLIAKSASKMTISLRTNASIDAAFLRSLDSIDGIECNGAVATFVAPDANRAMAQLIEMLNAHHIEIVELHAQKATLEAVVASLM